MYLQQLDENMKQTFINLAYYLCSVDGTFSDEEKMIMQVYLKEVGLSEESVKKESLEESMSSLQAITDDKIKKIILFELLGLAYVDKGYSEKEEILIKDIVKYLRLEVEYVEQIETLIKRYLVLQDKINRVVLGD